MTRRKGIPAGEAMAQLERDPAYLEMVRKRDEALQQRHQELAQAQAPLVRELRATGLAMSSVWDLVNTRKDYSSVIPILLKHLDRPYPERIREGIARALAVPGARMGWTKLVASFLAADGPIPAGLDVNEVKWGLHLAIAAAADKSVLDELISLIVDRRHGAHRDLFVDALARIGGPKAEATLDEMKDDPLLADAFKRLARKRKRRCRP